jgi:hypothetical protein
MTTDGLMIPGLPTSDLLHVDFWEDKLLPEFLSISSQSQWTSCSRPLDSVWSVSFSFPHSSASCRHLKELLASEFQHVRREVLGAGKDSRERAPTSSLQRGPGSPPVPTALGREYRDKWFSLS